MLGHPRLGGARHAVQQQRAVGGQCGDGDLHQALVADVVGLPVIASDLDAKAIFTPTALGSTAKRIVRFRPSQFVLALSHHKNTLKFLNLYWGVIPVEIAEAKSLDDLFEICTKAALRYGRVKKGDMVVITAGVPLNRAGSTNLIKVQRVE